MKGGDLWRTLGKFKSEGKNNLLQTPLLHIGKINNFSEITSPFIKLFSLNFILIYLIKNLMILAKKVVTLQVKVDTICIKKENLNITSHFWIT
jgi:hypothetical protein